MPEQANLFDVGNSSTLAARRLDLPGADVTYLPGFFPSPDSDRLLDELDETTVWRQEVVKMYGKETPIPRLTAWYGNPGSAYTYSKILMEPEPWTPPLSEIKERVEHEAGIRFNSVLLNLYRDGRDGVAWHSDDESELGAEPVIASVSLGATRKLQIRHKTDKSLGDELELVHGSLLVMRGATQLNYQHQVPKTAKAVEPRINLTFRRIG